ncbi:hypothetical protein Hypma_015294 [Hypsizygus marmoreus]|uniref:Uncharacterized protein n=1 Tax=Hypsizygus marmoreus TaxID=39966 RepID=A0A369K5R5_HYPMA|nr:hypothetical protein Hypma_015294 [Hypsizygus marmoreus]
MSSSTEGLVVPSQNAVPVFDPPPKYSAPSALTSFFHPPSFDDVMRQSDFDDPGRLPTYQSRQLERYHPYWKYRPPSPSRNDITRYFNTIYDEEYIPLDVPPRVEPTVPPPFPAITAVPLAPAFVPIVSRETQSGPIAFPALPQPRPVQMTWNHEGGTEDEHRRRIYRLRAVMIQFLMAVRRAIEMSAVEEPVVDAELAALMTLFDRSVGDEREDSEPADMDV